MLRIDGNPSYDEPPQDLAPELQQFINAVSFERKLSGVEGFESGRRKIYAMVPGTAGLETLDSDELDQFIGRLRQADPPEPDDYTDALIQIRGEDLWATFFHVNQTGESPSTAARAYVHATDWKAGLEIMRRVADQLGKNPGVRR